MNTRHVIDHLPETVRSQLFNYSSMIAKTTDFDYSEELRAKTKGYITALADMETISKAEAKFLRLFYTIDLPKSIKGAAK